MLLAALAFLIVRRLTPVPKVKALPRSTRFCLAAAGFVGGVFGARIPFLLGIDGHSAGWLADGKTITTGLIGAYLSVELVKWILEVNIKTGSSFALPVAIAIAIGRWGCFFNGCCFGTPTNLPWGYDFGDGVPRHPTQIYESLIHFGMAMIIIQPWVRRTLGDHCFQFYLIGYAGYRFVTEWIRPEPKLYGGLTFYQIASLVLATGLTIQWIMEVQRSRKQQENR